jgi:membrane protein DedA with SNARE-associated domain
MLIAMLIEGPIITAAAAFAVALGYFDLTAVFLLSLAGDLLADVAYYGIGWVGRKQLAERWGHRVGLTTERMQHMEKLLEQHTVKTILILKLTPVLPTPGLILVGALRIPIRKFTLISLLITLPKTIFFMLLGFYSGYFFHSNNVLVTHASWTLFGGAVLLIVISMLFNKVGGAIARKFERL